MNKYKLVGILAGAAAVSYGAYEIYGKFGPSSISSENYKDNPAVEAIEEEELNRDLLNNDGAPKGVVDNIVGEAPETPQSEQKLEPKQDPVPKSIEVPESKTQPQTKKPRVDGEDARTSHLKNLHLNSDGTIKIFPESIGSRFQGDLMISNKDDQAWKHKVNTWAADLKDYEESKGQTS